MLLVYSFCCWFLEKARSLVVHYSLLLIALHNLLLNRWFLDSQPYRFQILPLAILRVEYAWYEYFVMVLVEDYLKCTYNTFMGKLWKFHIFLHFFFLFQYSVPLLHISHNVRPSMDACYSHSIRIYMCCHICTTTSFTLLSFTNKLTSQPIKNAISEFSGFVYIDGCIL